MVWNVEEKNEVHEICPWNFVDAVIGFGKRKVEAIPVMQKDGRFKLHCYCDLEYLPHFWVGWS